MLQQQTAAQIYNQAWAKGFRPEPLLTVSSWSDRHRMLSSRAAAEPGPWRTARTPYLREVMDALSPSNPTERVVFMKSAQIGATEMGLNWLGYVIAQAPGPMMIVGPTVEMVKRVSKQRIQSLIEDTPALRRLVRDPRSRDSGNTVLMKEFAGGVLVMAGANSAVGLRSMPVRYLMLDECDGFPPDADGEGDPIALAMMRTATFARRKVLLISTPTIAGASRIEAAYAESDQRRYFVPCPDCGEFQVLTWPNVRWPKGQPEKAAYVCTACGTVIDNHQKAAMLARGEWRPGAAGDGRTAGFHINALYSPWQTWPQIAVEFMQAKDSNERLKSWTNLALGESFAERGEAPEWRRLFDRREGYKLATVPVGGLFLTAGVDVQRDRVEVQVVAWGPRDESWLVDHRIIMGKPWEPEVWRDLTALLSERFPHAQGKSLQIGRLAIDSGFASAECYGWVRGQDARTVMAIKGMDSMRTAIGAPTTIDVLQSGKRVSAGIKLWPVGVSMLKRSLFNRLRQDPPIDAAEDHPPGYCHFPTLDESFFKGLCSENLIRRVDRRGYVKWEWKKLVQRNEPLDCRIYAMAAAEAAGVPRWTPETWATLRAELAAEAPPARLAPTVIPSRWLMS